MSDGDRSVVRWCGSSRRIWGRGGIGGRRGCRTGRGGSAVVRWRELTLLLGWGGAVGAAISVAGAGSAGTGCHGLVAWDDCARLSAHRLALKSWTLLGCRDRCCGWSSAANGANGCRLSCWCISGIATAGVVSAADSSTRAGARIGPTAVAGTEVAAVVGTEGARIVSVAGGSAAIGATTAGLSRWHGRCTATAGSFSVAGSSTRAVQGWSNLRSLVLRSRPCWGPRRQIHSAAVQP